MMYTLKIKLDLNEKVKGRSGVPRQEHIKNLFLDPVEIHFENADIIEIKNILSARNERINRIMKKFIDEIRNGYFFITATVTLERDGQNIGFVTNVYGDLYHHSEVILLDGDGEHFDFDILNLETILDNFALVCENEFQEFKAGYLDLTTDLSIDQ